MPNWIPIVSETDRNKVKGWVSKAPPGTLIAFKKENARTLEQNKLLWPLLSEISKSVIWDGKHRNEWEWKDIFTSALRGYEVVPGLHPGTFVPLGMRTSSFETSEFSALLEIIYAFGAKNGVVFREDAP